MIPVELEAKILRLHHAEKWPPGTIAKQVGVHHTTVRRVLRRAGLAVAEPQRRRSMADPFVPFIKATLKEYPQLTASRLYQMVKERGYPGRPDHFRVIVARYRPRRPAEAYLRLRTLPGEQAQVDWGHFGRLRVGNANRQLMAFVVVLSWSRQIFLRFFLGAHAANFTRGHVDAFNAFGGVPRVLLYDNLKSAVLERYGDAIRFNPRLLELAAHYRFEPRPVAVARGNEKGRVERAIRYIRNAFFAARSFTDIDDLNAQADAWCGGLSADRQCPEDRSMTVREALVAERPRLLELPEAPFPADERAEVSVGKTPYVRFDLNDYSVPSDCVRRLLHVRASLTTVRVLLGNEVVAEHERTFSKGEVVEDPGHVEALISAKRKARKHRAQDRLQAAAASSAELLVAMAERGANLGSATSRLCRLLDQHGGPALEEAVAEAVQRNAMHVAAVQQVLERNRHRLGQPPALAVELPQDPRVRDLVVKPHRLDSYDTFQEGADDDHDH